MPDQPFLSLVADNSRRILEQRREQSLVRFQPPLSALKPKSPLPARRKPFVPPVAYRRHLDTKQPRDGCCAAERVNHRGYGMQIISHAEEYSVSLKNVKRQSAESVFSAAGRIFKAMASRTNLSPRRLMGLRLRAAREALDDKSQADICRALSVAPNKWNQWETGTYPPDPAIMVRFADTFGTSLDWIFRERADCIVPTDRAQKTLDRYYSLLQSTKAPAKKTA